MIIAILRRFAATRRSAVAIIFAVSILPLMMLVGIAVDFTFLSQARTQAAFAAQAAAVHAVRMADATYALEVQHGSTAAVATAHAKAAGNNAGNLWFNDDIGTLSFASISVDSTNTTSTNDNSSPPNFTAVNSYTFSYPPIFNPLFGSPTKKWTYASGATATSQFAYAQILFMLDTSNSMLIGATSNDVTTMEDHAVCPQTGTIVPALGSSDSLSYNTPYVNDYNFAYGDNTWIGLSPGDPATLPKALHYNTNGTATGTEPADSTVPGGKSPYQTNGPCDSGYNISGAPFSPCALACHNQPTAQFAVSKTVNGVTTKTYYPADLYGLARSEGATMRIDVLLSATETAIQDIASTEAVSNQISVGVYQFNADVSTIARGTSGDALPEATSNLTTALADVQNVDYNHNPSETSIPVLVTDCQTYIFPTQETCGGNTNLVLSMQHLLSGNLPTDSGAKALTASGSGATTTTPIKFMFLITDGMEDEAAADGATDLISNPNYTGKGVMTNETDETAVSTGVGAGTCTAIKKLGYTLYVLYVDYLPVSQSQYYLTPAGNVSSQTTNDFPSAKYLVNIADSEPYLAAGGTSEQITAQIAANVPTAKALSQCASSPSDFYSANSASDIQTALNTMLKAALASTTRLTN